MTIALGCPGLMLYALVFPQASAGLVQDQTALLTGQTESSILSPSPERAALMGRSGTPPGQSSAFDKKHWFDRGGFETFGLPRKHIALHGGMRC